ncbi:MAG TPA: thioredoxin domain-containing protein [Actinomycetota bacterium]|nr:thioredoxin domain-containing protein [Actinomycetota bacterium]
MNRLGNETSPYLLQHANNPVDWYPWGPEALTRAKTQDKPILLSIGYAACHWCHVMEHESFEDPETAAVMNEHFVPVKVDREERPDLDSIYMDAVQAMTGHGGWPMTVFLTPEGRPFYAGTYFPKEARHGLPGFKTVLQAVVEAWRDQRDRIHQQGEAVVQSVGRISGLRESTDPLNEQVLQQAVGGLRQAFDARWGGFGGAPKFPQPMTLEFLLRAHQRGVAEPLAMVEHTLEKMADGGIRDQLGGGFHRYSVDERWHVPHFEKMLYDNAQLIRLYARAWQVTGRERFRNVAEETADYLLREMRHPEGGFFSSQDADSEGEEGKFFVWSYDELVETAAGAVRDRDRADAVAAYFGAIPEGNWEDGKNVLWTPFALERVADEAGLSPNDLLDSVQRAQAVLFDARERRVRPATDDKILVAWNGLAISALGEAGRAFGMERFVDAAVEAADFVLERLRRKDGRLLRAWRDGRTSGPAYLDDYAMLAEACLTLYETTFDARFFTTARSLCDDILAMFRDSERGGFFQTGSDAESLVVRPKELFDNAVPSGNSVAALVLQRMALLTGEDEYERAGVSALRLVRDFAIQSPTGFGYALTALDFYLSPVREVAIVGTPGADDTERLVNEVHGRFLPNVVLAVAAPGDEGDIELLRDRPARDGKATAYVCERFVCQQPVTEPEKLREQLEAGATP